MKPKMRKISTFAMLQMLQLCCLVGIARPTLAITAFGIEGGLSREQPPPRPDQIWDNPLMRPAFGDTPNVSSTPVGRVAHMHCKVYHLGSRVVTWIRKRDSHVLTAGLFSYTSDQRFTALHAEGSSDWLLKITSPQTRDSGIYECQVSTEPKISRAFTLRVIESKAVIDGPVSRHMSAGTTLSLQCWASGAGQQPTYFYWYHNDEVIRYSSGTDLRYRRPGNGNAVSDATRDVATRWNNNYDDGSVDEPHDEVYHLDEPRDESYREIRDESYVLNESQDESYRLEESRDESYRLDESQVESYREPGDESHRLDESGVLSVAILEVKHLGSGHSGNYTCAPENSVPSTVTVYVLRAGEQPAAMQHGGARKAASHAGLVLLVLQTGAVQLLLLLLLCR
ncbi:uncharacterized protein LOC108679741 [Hyalella azteca]|uniref:Uncharacterized protein LOC108679741 n=1 Tax=Hyalella azteca TaxID=294128 RepID=A0A8B7PD73_HYAAZ|nr:uncharacterized protein LOC108679741 [Hyalella azteca]